MSAGERHEGDGQHLPCRDAPVGELATSTSCCVVKRVPTGSTMRPPGLSCLSSGGGMWPATAVTTITSNGAASGQP